MTKIEWTHRPGTTGETWNPVTGCTKISAGCKNCYAERMSKRLAGGGLGIQRMSRLG
jgi:protein gp37